MLNAHPILERYGNEVNEISEFYYKFITYLLFFCKPLVVLGFSHCSGHRLFAGSCCDL